MIEAVIFDMDGVLIDSEPLWREAEIICFEKAGINLTEQDCRKTTGLRIKEVVEYWQNIHRWPFERNNKIQEDILSTVFKLIDEKGVAMEGVENALVYAKANGLKIALGSSSPMVLIDKVVEKLRLKLKFQAIISAENELYGKPHPAVFLNTANELKVNPLKCLVVEDSVQGMIAAKAARMQCVVVPDRENYMDNRFQLADYKIKSLNNFTDILSKHYSVGKSIGRY